jgi:hypothetical protein
MPPESTHRSEFATAMDEELLREEQLGFAAGNPYMPRGVRAASRALHAFQLDAKAVWHILQEND